MMTTAGIAGAGLMGRLVAIELLERDWNVTLFDRDTREGEQSAAYTGAGMLAPWCELESCEPEISRLGEEAMVHWPAFLQQLDQPVGFQQNGSLVVAHPRDEGELSRLQRRVSRHIPHASFMEIVSHKRIGEIEPELSRTFNTGLFFPREGHVNNRDLMSSMRITLERRGVTWNHRTAVTGLAPGRVCTANGQEMFDWAFDCRGLGARTDMTRLRGVRGEVLYLYAPDVRLQRPVRLMHPRYPLYVIPREGNTFVIGATSIESDDMGEVTVRSILEMLSAAYSLHSGFAEARVLGAFVNCRPALPDNRPCIVALDGLLRINGLYRHGFLLGPALIQRALSWLETGTVKDTWLFRDVPL